MAPARVADWRTRTRAILITSEQRRPGGRDEIVTTFLSHPGRAVLLVSAAGASSLCIDAGCESCVLMGTAQWSPSDYSCTRSCAPWTVMIGVSPSSLPAHMSPSSVTSRTTLRSPKSLKASVS